MLREQGIFIIQTLSWTRWRLVFGNLSRDIHGPTPSLHLFTSHVSKLSHANSSVSGFGCITLL